VRGQLGPGVWLTVDSVSPFEVHDGDASPVPATSYPTAGTFYLIVSTSLHCTPEVTAICDTTPHPVTLALLDANGISYGYTTQPGASPDLLNAPMSTPSGEEVVSGYSAFSVVDGRPGAFVLRATRGATAVYFVVGA
jgi:hypothetical protein